MEGFFFIFVILMLLFGPIGTVMVVLMVLNALLGNDE
jgi:hypothetical protein